MILHYTTLQTAHVGQNVLSPTGQNVLSHETKCPGVGQNVLSYGTKCLLHIIYRIIIRESARSTPFTHTLLNKNLNQKNIRTR